MKFVPLHVYSTYTFLKSGLTIDRIKESVLKNDYFGCALTDLNVMYAVPRFIMMMESIKRPFIIGIDIELENNYFSVYALDEEGYYGFFINSDLSYEPGYYDIELSMYADEEFKHLNDISEYDSIYEKLIKAIDELDIFN